MDNLEKESSDIKGNTGKFPSEKKHENTEYTKINKFYAVRAGKIPGVYTLWKECQKQIENYTNPVFRKFDNLQDAQEFVKGISKRDKPEHYSYPDWHKTGLEMAQDVLADIQSLQQARMIKTCKDELDRIYDNKSHESNKQPEAQEKDLTKEKTQPVSQRFNVWIDGETSEFGTIAVYFGENDERNYSGVFNWKPPIEKTRVKLAAVVRAMSIILKYAKSNNIDSSVCSMIIHTTSRYLCKAIIEFLKMWPKIPEDKNADIYKMLQRQLKSTKLRIHCALETDKDNENCIQAHKMATSFKRPSFMI